MKSSNETLISILWPFRTCQANILTLLQVLNHYFETVGEVAETRTLLCQVYKAKFLSKYRECNSSNEIWSEFCDFCAHAQPIFLLCCKFQSIIFETEGEVAGRKPYYVMWWLRHQRYITLPLIIWSEFYDIYAHAQSICLLWYKFQTINYRRSCRDIKSTLKCDWRTDTWMDTRMYNGE